MPAYCKENKLSTKKYVEREKDLSQPKNQGLRLSKNSVCSNAEKAYYKVIRAILREKQRPKERQI